MKRFFTIVATVLVMASASAQDVTSFIYETRNNSADCINCSDTIGPGEWSRWYAAYTSITSDGLRVKFNGPPGCGVLLVIEQSTAALAPYTCNDTIDGNGFCDWVENNGCGDHGPQVGIRAEFLNTNAQIQVEECGQAGNNYGCVNTVTNLWGLDSVIPNAVWGNPYTWDGHHGSEIKFKIVFGGNAGQSALDSTQTSSTGVTCFEDSTGTATVIPFGGTPPYSYQWDANTGFQTTQTATGLTGGMYLVSVNDSLGTCPETDTIWVSTPLQLTSTADTGLTACAPGQGGAAAGVYATGGTGSYSYLWDGPAGNQTTQTATGLPIGTYVVTVTDSVGCTTTDTVTVVQQYPTLAVAITSSDAMGQFLCTGWGNTSPSVGPPLYSYQWDDPNTQSTQTAVNLCPGIYHVTVTDGNGCSQVDSVDIGITANINDLITEGDITVYPNPTNGEFFVALNSAVSKKITVELYDMLGKIVLKERMGTVNSGHIQKFSTKNLSGTYSLRLKVDGEVITKQLIFQK